MIKHVFILMVFNFLFSCTSSSNAQSSIYDINIKSISGDIVNLREFQGKKILFVNVASNCGFTNQYSALEELNQIYNQDLIIIGVPCNQFGGQEPGGSEEIIKFCESKYGVSFLMTEKIEVKGENQHPLYKWLCNKDQNGVKNSSVLWNFQKYLIDEEGKLIDVFYSVTTPLSPKIVNYLK